MIVVDGQLPFEEYIRMAFFTYKDGDISLDPDNVYKEKDLEDVDDVHQFLMDKLPPEDPRYFLYYCRYETIVDKGARVVSGMLYIPILEHKYSNFILEFTH